MSFKITPKRSFSILGLCEPDTAEPVRHPPCFRGNIPVGRIARGSSPSGCTLLSSRSYLDALRTKESGTVHDEVGTDHVLGLTSAKQIHHGILSAIKLARSHVDVEFSSLSEEEVVNALIDKMKRNQIKVRVIVPETSRSISSNPKVQEHHETLLRHLQENGAEIRRTPERYLKKKTFLRKPENHRKILIVDSELAYVGSMNPRGFQKGFEASVFVEGTTVTGLIKIFESDWKDAGGKTEFQAVMDETNPCLRVLDAKTPNHSIKEAILQGIAMSENSISLSQYWLDDEEIMASLIARKELNPEMNIKVILNHNPLIHSFLGMNFSRLLNGKAFTRLKRAGIPVKYNGGEFIHAKAIVFDRKKVLLGSADFCERSFYANIEIALWMESSGIASFFDDAITEQFERGIDGTKEKNNTPVTLLLSFLIKIMRNTNPYMPVTLAGKISVHAIRLYSRIVRASGARIVFKKKRSPLICSLTESENRIMQSMEAHTKFHLQNKTSLDLPDYQGGPLFFFARPRINSEASKTPDLNHLICFGDRGDPNGLYVTTNPESAVLYGLIRMEEQKTDAFDIVVVSLKQGRALKKLTVFDWTSEHHQFASWFAANYPFTPPIHMPRHYDEFFRSGNYDATVMLNREPGTDYYIFPDSNLLQVVCIYNFHARM